MSTENKRSRCDRDIPHQIMSVPRKKKPYQTVKIFFTGKFMKGI